MRARQGDVPLPPVERTSAGLRNALFDALDALRNGTMSANNANAVAKIADGVIQTVKMEMEVQRHMARVSQDQGAPPPSLGAPINLGTQPQPITNG